MQDFLNKDIHVAVVEDQRHIRRGIVSMLRRIGETFPMCISEFADAESALVQYCNAAPQIMFVDVQLKRMDGLELLEKMRGLSFGGRAVIISSYDRFDYARRAICARVDDYLLKPVDYEELYKLVARLVHGTETERDAADAAMSCSSAPATGPLILQGDFEALGHALLAGSKQMTEDLLETVFARLDAAAVNKPRVIDEFVSVINYACHSLFVNGGKRGDGYSVKSITGALAACHSLLLMKLKVRDFLFDMLAEVQGKSSANYIVNYVYRYVEKNYNTRISLKTIAGEMRVTYSYVSAVFSQTCGISFSDYLLSFRLRKAALMLVEPGSNVGATAGKCGFYDSQSFSKAFKRTYGMTPREYRNRRVN